jgi:hypothetical protein
MIRFRRGEVSLFVSLFREDLNHILELTYPVRVSRHRLNVDLNLAIHIQIFEAFQEFLHIW